MLARPRGTVNCWPGGFRNGSLRTFEDSSLKSTQGLTGPLEVEILKLSRGTSATQMCQPNHCNLTRTTWVITCSITPSSKAFPQSHTGIHAKSAREWIYAATHNTFSLATKLANLNICSWTPALGPVLSNRLTPEEVPMEIGLRLNVIAVIMSFAFLAAVVLGMV